MINSHNDGKSKCIPAELQQGILYYITNPRMSIIATVKPRILIFDIVKPRIFIIDIVKARTLIFDIV